MSPIIKGLTVAGAILATIASAIAIDNHYAKAQDVSQLEDHTTNRFVQMEQRFYEWEVDDLSDRIINIERVPTGGRTPTQIEELLRLRAKMDKMKTRLELLSK